MDLRGLRGYIDHYEEDWPTLVFWDNRQYKIELGAGICGWPIARELAAQGAELLATMALIFAKEIREYQR